LRNHKYGAVRTNGYASKAEADYAAELKLRRLCGLIHDVSRPEPIHLTAGIRYQPDFTFTENGQRVWVDVKGVETPAFRLKARLWAVYGPGLLRVVKRNGRVFEVDREITGAGAVGLPAVASRRLAPASPSPRSPHRTPQTRHASRP
jgi:hypothetical protein